MATWAELAINNPYPFAAHMAAREASKQAQLGQMGSLYQNLYNQQGNTIGAQQGLLQAQFRNQYQIPMDIARIRAQLLENRSRVNQNFGPNRARRAFIGGI